jgi:hypothetical protein
LIISTQHLFDRKDSGFTESAPASSISPLQSRHFHRAAFIKPGPPRAFIKRHEQARGRALAQSHRDLNGASSAKQIIQQVCTLKLKVRDFGHVRKFILKKSITKALNPRIPAYNLVQP